MKTSHVNQIYYFLMLLHTSPPILIFISLSVFRVRLLSVIHHRIVIDPAAVPWIPIILNSLVRLQYNNTFSCEKKL